MTFDAKGFGQEALTAGHFRGFFSEVHGYAPFPWQEALLERVLADGWPELIDVPTGLGKTAVLDVAVFMSALRSEYARRRIFLVVDRRLIVDQAFQEAQALRQAIAGAAPGTICHLVRERLAAEGDDKAAVLGVTRMRSGVNWSWLWLERPDRHAIVTGTVDQIGSRLLFRGYGVGEKIRPIDAALVGTDSLIVIDEAHLSDPFLRTTGEVRKLDSGIGCPPVVVAMSASPEHAGTRAHGITGADESHPVAGKRLRASKSLHAVAVTASAGSAPSAVADALASWARQLGGPGKVVGIVANTVSMARGAFERIQGDLGGQAGCVLLTGRIRPIDREYLLHAWYPAIRSGAAREPGTELYVIATQTIEAGADIDLDAMVTEAAPLSALVQRLGRVNRMGERTVAPVVVVRTEKLPDLVYGPASEETWQWLTSLRAPLVHKAGHTMASLGEGIPVSPAALRDLVGRIPGEQQQRMRGVHPYVPVISAATLDAWARTSPTPHPDAPVAAYLHGIGAGEPTVSLAWRADLRGNNPEEWIGSVQRIPPCAEEALELPISAARRWLVQPEPGRLTGTKATRNADVGTSDLESQALDTSEPDAVPIGAPRRALRCEVGNRWEAVTERQVRPGDLLVVPASWGGCDRYGWHPGSLAPVTDLADFTGGALRRRTTAIRIGRVLTDALGVLAPHLREEVSALIIQMRNDIRDELAPSSSADRRYQDLLLHLINWKEPVLPHEQVLSRLAAVGKLSVLDDSAAAGDEPTERVAGLFAAAGSSWNDDDSPAGTSLAPERKPLTLAAHQAAVGERAREFARNLNLAEPLARAVELAARYHDEGKRDPRFQVMLHAGDHWATRAAAEPLAKSGMDPADRAAHQRAAQLSGYPPGMRHEAMSAQIAAACLPQLADEGVDSDLVVHLVATHHGHARPLLPAVVDPHPEKVRVPAGNGETAVFDTASTVDWTGPARFRELCDRYGRWGLVLLETIVRLADIWCSARSEECDAHRS